MSWSWNRDLAYFWPQEWLPLEPELRETRILSFGYNAHFLSQTKDIFNVTDFAKELLVQMRFGNDANVQSLNMGRVPIIFVVHSMGGLVAKKAYILGSQDPQFQHIVDSVCGMVFLATPHRGSNLAEMLNKFLAVSFQSTKQYVTDLQKNSARIVDINEQFRNHAEKLEIVSFYETQQTSVGMKRLFVVERDSAALGYPREISLPLNADHHTVSKFQSRDDPNYVKVRDMIKSMVERFKAPPPPQRRLSTDTGASTVLDDVMGRLSIAGGPSDSLDMLEHRGPGSCDWILADAPFLAFLGDDSPHTSVFHITGRPGSGKSMLASFLTEHLSSQGMLTQSWYFRYDDQLKRSIRQCLLSLSFQVAKSYPDYSKQLQSMVADIESIMRSDIRTIWQKLFLNILDKLIGPETLYWVIDAVDESESAQSFLALLGGLKALRFPLRLIILSRPQTVARYFDKLRLSLQPRRVSQTAMATSDDSIALFISEKLELTPWPDDVRETVTKTLLEKSQGNFLWLNLVMKQLEDINTDEELQQALEETPMELVELYRGIEASLAQTLKPQNLRLVQAILAWVTCSERPLNLQELGEALADFKLLNIKATITSLCGEFVTIDKNDTVSMIHYTARDFLIRPDSTGLSLDSAKANTLIFSKCLDILTGSRFQRTLKSKGLVGLIRYCCLSWSYHLSQCGIFAMEKQSVQKLAGFFKSSACLSWIEAVASTGQLRVLTATARALTTYVERRRNFDYNQFHENPMTQPLLETDLLRQWSTDLVRIVGKFGPHLLQHPGSVNTLVPLFCPPESAVGQQFQPTALTAPRITGISATGWDDSLAKFNLGLGQRPKAVYTLDSYFAILTSDKAVNLYHASTFQEARRFLHGENIVTAEFSLDGTRLATCGPKSVNIWDTTSARLLHSFANPRGIRAMSVAFSRDALEVIVCWNDSKLSRQSLEMPEDWVPVPFQWWDDHSTARAARGTPVCTSISLDGSQIAVAFRSAPLSVWGTENGNLVGRIERVGNRATNSSDPTGYAKFLTWNPVSEHVVGIYHGGTIFKWDPLEKEVEDMGHSVVAAAIACSPDGRLLVAGQRNGSLKIFNFETFTLLYNLSGMFPANALAVSPDGRRIYDLRQSFCNVWEPNALIRMAEQEERGSDTASSHYDASIAISIVSEASASVLAPVTAVCADRDGPALVFGNDDGVVTYLHADGLAPVNVPCGFQVLGITCLTLHGGRIAMSSMDRKLSVRKMTADGRGVEGLIFEGRSEDPVVQLLLSDDGNYLTSRCHRSVNVWSLLEPQAAPVCHPNGSEPSHWILDPFNPSQLVAVSPTSITSHKLPDLAAKGHWFIETNVVQSADFEVAPTVSRRPSTAYHMGPGEVGETVDKVLVASNSSVMLVQTSRTSAPQGRREIRLMMLGTEFLSRSASGDSSSPQPTVAAQPLPNAVLREMEIPLGFVAQEMRRGSGLTATRPTTDQRYSLAFIDRDYWVRTWSLDDVEGMNSRRHFFLPRDWINMDCLELATMTADGRFICPRNGELAMVHNGLQLEWRD